MTTKSRYPMTTMQEDFFRWWCPEEPHYSKGWDFVDVDRKNYWSDKQHNDWIGWWGGGEKKNVYLPVIKRKTRRLLVWPAEGHEKTLESWWCYGKRCKKFKQVPRLCDPETFDT